MRQSDDFWGFRTQQIRRNAAVKSELETLRAELELMRKELDALKPKEKKAGGGK